MPLRLDIKKQLAERSDRVKCVDFHPTEPWTLSALYSGNVFIWDFNTQTLVKQFEVCTLPIRSAKFCARKQWIVTASDDMHVRMFNYNSLEKVHEIDAHSDYIRYIAIHPTMSYILSASDDMTIKMWDWEKNWQNTHVFQGHAHYVMMCQWNPKDSLIFCSCSLDRSIKVWGVGGTNTSPHFSLTGHQRGVNCVEYSPNGDKPYIISGSDDKTVKIWDYHTHNCIQTLTGHTNNISATLFHPTLPIILTGSEDGTARVWHASTYRLEATLNYFLERAWSIAVLPGSNAAAIGYDEGTVVIKIGSEDPVASMHSGKIVWAKGTEIQTVNLKLLDELANAADGERLAISVRDMGAAEIYPQYVEHHPNGRLFAVCGDGEFVIYTAQALRNKSFGQATEFVWSDAGGYATRDASGKVTVFQDFKESFSFKPAFAVDEIFGGALLGVRSNDFVCFYDWNEYRPVRKVEVVPKSAIWSEDGRNVVLACADSFYVLKHDREATQAALAAGSIDEDGVEAAFDLVTEISDKIVSGTWVSDCFVYVSSTQRLVCLVAGSQETLSHLDRPLHLLGYMPDVSKLIMVDKELNVITYSLHQSLVDYQSAIMQKDFTSAELHFKQLPESLHNRVARFLESQSYIAEALEISKDDEHKFELAVQLGKLEMAADIIAKISAQANPAMPPRGKWKQLGDVALEQGDFTLARRCFSEATDLAALFLIHSASGDVQGLTEVAKLARDAGVANIAVLSYLLAGDCKSALDVLVQAKRLPEAAFFARTYCPSGLPEVVVQWKQDLARVNQAVSDSLASPSEYPDLFPDYKLTLTAEQVFKKRLEKAPLMATAYNNEKQIAEMDVMQEIKRLGPSGFENMIMQTVGAPRPSVVRTPSPVASPAASTPSPLASDVSSTAPVQTDAQPAPEVAIESSAVGNRSPEMTTSPISAPEEALVHDEPEVARRASNVSMMDLL